MAILHSEHIVFKFPKIDNYYIKWTQNNIDVTFTPQVSKWMSL